MDARSLLEHPTKNIIIALQRTQAKQTNTNDKKPSFIRLDR